MDHVNKLSSRLDESPEDFKNKSFRLSVVYLPLLMQRGFSCEMYPNKYCKMMAVSTLAAPI